ncbi:MAG TPA: hypothetical protein VE684_01505 [Crenalkalicoccus sp.]|jgi:sugar lactone lactonase YvrE|nr:hypothetical protein [Crenalkalicoccus sp.]
MAIAIDRIGDTKDRLGESPFWSAREGCLCRGDSLAGLLHRRRRRAGGSPSPVSASPAWPSR